jgi:signal transduction histidine kinase
VVNLPDAAADETPPKRWHGRAQATSSWRPEVGTRREAFIFMTWLLVPVLALLAVLSFLQYTQLIREAERDLLRQAAARAQDVQAITLPARRHVLDLVRLLQDHWDSPSSEAVALRKAVKPFKMPKGQADGWTLDDASPDQRDRFGQLWWAPPDGMPPSTEWLGRAALFTQFARLAYKRDRAFEGTFFVSGDLNVSWGYPWSDTPTMLRAMGLPSLRALDQPRIDSVERGRHLLALKPDTLTFWGLPYVSQLHEELVVSHGSVVLVNGRYTGEVNIDFRLQPLQEAATQWQPANGRVWLVTKSGHVVADSASPLQRPAGQGLADWKVVAKLADRLPVTLSPDEWQLLQRAGPPGLIRKGAWILVTARKEDAPWQYVLAMPASALRASVLPTLVPNGLLAAALLALTALGTVLFARRFVTPSLRLLDYVRRSSKDPDAALPELAPRWRGWVKAVSGIAKDRHRAQQQLDRQREVLRQNERLSVMGSLLAGVAHELNNPLAIVAGRAALLDDRLQSVPQLSASHQDVLRGDVRSILQATDRCARIVRTFLNMARQRPPVRSSVLLADAVQTAAELMDRNLKDQGIRLVLHLDRKLPPLQADGDQVVQVVLNLLLNAQQSLAGRERPRIDVSMGQDIDETRHCQWIRVADNGAGIPAEWGDRIFQPFFSGRGVTAGTGLGLSMSRNIAREHSGDLVLEASEKGAHFKLVLPSQPLN